MVKDRVNIAPSSTEGHFVEGHINVVKLDEITESFYVKGKSRLVTKNHTSLDMNESCFVNCQMVCNHFKKKIEKSRD